jgi:hypothetical protein
MASLKAVPFIEPSQARFIFFMRSQRQAPAYGSRSYAGRSKRSTRGKVR